MQVRFCHRAVKAVLLSCHCKICRRYGAEVTVESASRLLEVQVLYPIRASTRMVVVKVERLVTWQGTRFMDGRDLQFPGCSEVEGVAL